MFKRIDHTELLTAQPERTRIPQTPSGPLDLVYLELGGTTVEVMCFPEVKTPIAPRSAEPRLGWQCNPIELRQWYRPEPPQQKSRREAGLTKRGPRLRGGDRQVSEIAGVSAPSWRPSGCRHGSCTPWGQPCR